RGLPIDRLAARPGAIRQLAACDHFDKATGEITTWPAMATAISGAGGNVTGLHLTWLQPDGRGKAPVDKPKKMRGVVVGGAIRLSKGAAKLSPEAAAQAGKTGPLIITEGIEDALTAAIARPDDRVWAAGSLSLLGELAWPDCASSVVLVADNDWLKPAAVAAFEAVEAKWREMARGRPLKVVRAEVGKDLNDWARGEGAPQTPEGRG
ncbi:MAG: toprim domain-containing protein, partial [Caulobacteraceae bacterium]|nr:toprim domain-containing protein [Caulobacteraceae bacterium]